MTETTLLAIRGHHFAVQSHNIEKPGTPLVFIHGITASVNFWELILPADIRDERPWYSFSLPCHFPSQFPQPFAPIEIHPELFADLMAEALKQLKVTQKVALVGWSTGGFSAVNFAFRYGDLVQKVMSISGFASGPWKGLVGAMALLTYFGRPGRWLFRTLIRKTWNSDAWFRWSMLKGAANTTAYREYPLLDEQVAIMQADARQHDPHAMSWMFRRVPSFDLTPHLPKITVPAWIVSGDKDPLVPFAQSRLLAETIPGARLITFPGCGHMFFAEATDQWHATLREFVASLD